MKPAIECAEDIFSCKPDDLLVDITKVVLGFSIGTVLACIFLFLSWRDGIKLLGHAGGLMSSAGDSVRRRLDELPKAKKNLAIATTILVSMLELMWLFLVFIVGNLGSLLSGRQRDSITRFDLSSPLDAIGALSWDAVSSIYVLIAVCALVVARPHYRREYGSEFLAFVVAAPALLVGGLAGIGAVLRLVLLGIALLFGGPTDLDSTFWTWLLLAGAAAAYLGLCILALRAAVFIGNVWFGDVHNPGRDALLGNRPIGVQAKAYFRAFYRKAKSDPASKPKRLNWRTRGWIVSAVTTSDDYSSRTCRLYVTTSGRPVYMGSTGKIEKMRDSYLGQFPIDWNSLPNENS